MVADATVKKKNPLRQVVMDYVNPPGGRGKDAWKGGEYSLGVIEVPI